MSSTLTAARAALYWGAKVSITKHGIIDKIVSLSDDRLQVHYFDDWFYIKDCKLILRTVEQLTREEEYMVMGLSNIDPTTHLMSIQFGNKICFFKDENTGFCTTLDLLPVSAADYLRSIHVDIDNAIADGWAVKKEVSHE